MLCDCIETGLGLKHTALLINKELNKDGLAEIGVSCLRESYLRLNPVTIKIRKVHMGTNDAHSPWAKASFNIYKQLAIAFDQLDPRVTVDPPMPPPLAPIAVAAPTLPPAATELEDANGNQEDTTHPLRDVRANPDRPAHETVGEYILLLTNETTELEDMFDPEKLRHYHVDQVAWWDESHRKCCLKTIQGANGCEYITRVRRDKNGNPTLEGEESSDSPVNVNVNVKYEKEARFAFGVALVMGNDGVEVGKRIPLFEYTERTILSRVDWKRKIREEIYSV